MDAENTVNLENCPYVVKSEDINYEDNFGIGYELFHFMKKYENNVAQCILEDNYEENYGFLLQKCISTAINLKSKRFCENPIIGICANNHANSSVPFIAATFLGYRVATLDGTMSARDTLFLLRQVPPAIIFIDEEFIPMMEETMRALEVEFELIVFGKHDRYTMFDEYLYKNGEEANFQPIQLQNTRSTGVILFSSGTTGRAKGIGLHHFGILKQAYATGILQGISSESVVYYQTTLYWMTSVTLMITCIMFGAVRVISPISKGWEAIDKYKVTHISISPFVATVLLDSEKPPNFKTNSVKSVWTAGTVLYPKLREKLIDEFPSAVVTQSYGQTELSGWITMFPYAEQRTYHLVADKRNRSVGRLMPGLSAKIIDPETKKTLGTNEVGELHLQCKSICMNGYFNRDASNEFDSEGWLKTGDLCYYDEDQYFYIVGRCKEVLKYQNFHIQPQMLEQILASHPAVDKAVVIGIKHKVDGEHPMGLVVLNKGENITPEVLEQYVEKHVQERQRLRAGVKIIEEIPFTPTGKPRKQLLISMVEEGKLG